MVRIGGVRAVLCVGGVAGAGWKLSISGRGVVSAAGRVYRIHGDRVAGILKMAIVGRAVARSLAPTIHSERV